MFIMGIVMNVVMLKTLKVLYNFCEVILETAATQKTHIKL